MISEDELRAAPESGAIRGVITERDYLRAVAAGKVERDTKVTEVMTDFGENPDALVSVTPDTSVLAALEIMSEQRIGNIPCISPASRDGTRGAMMEGRVVPSLLAALTGFRLDAFTPPSSVQSSPCGCREY